MPKIEISDAEIIRLLQGEGEYSGVLDFLTDAGHRIADQAGEGMEVETFIGIKRARVIIRTGTETARLAEATDRSLSAALDAGRG